MIEELFIAKFTLRVRRHVNPNGSIGGYVCAGIDVDPNNVVERDEIILSEKEYTNKTLFSLLIALCNDIDNKNIKIISYFCPTFKCIVKLHVGWKRVKEL